MRAIAFDFDGVIADTIGEMYLIASGSYERMTGKKFMNEKTYRKYRPFVKNTEDYYAIMLLLKSGKKVDFGIIDKIEKRHWAECADYARHYYKYRYFLMREQRKKWLSASKPHPEIIRLIKNLQKSGKVFIATARDKKSIRIMLRHCGLKIADKDILSREFSHDKAHHMDYISKRAKVPASKIIFVDDVVAHLEPLKKMGVKTILASWGYTTPDLVTRARKMKIPVAKKENLGKIIDSLSNV